MYVLLQRKCDQYWPELSEPQFYGDLVVNVQSESNMSDYVIRIFEVKLVWIFCHLFFFVLIKRFYNCNFHKSYESKTIHVVSNVVSFGLLDMLYFAITSGNKEKENKTFPFSSMA